jgi:apolipoprotein N-acyltransferase
VSLGERAIGRVDASTPEKRTRIALVQPNVDLALKWKPEFADSTFRLIDRLTRNAASLDPDVVVFPETSAPVYLRHNRTYWPVIQRLVADSGVELFIGYLDGRYDGPNGDLNVYNAAGLFHPNGTVGQYEKMHLLPFGETFPYSWKFRWLKNIDFGQANFQPGPQREPIPSRAGRLAPLICFESLFPGLARSAVVRGADVFLNITNDGWFGGTPGPVQHNDMAIIRSIENRRFLARSANTGITMVVDPAGRVVSSLEMDVEGILVEEIYLVEGTTLYTRIGDWPLLAVSVLIIAAGIPVWWRRRTTS